VDILEETLLGEFLMLFVVVVDISECATLFRVDIIGFSSI